MLLFVTWGTTKLYKRSIRNHAHPLRTTHSSRCYLILRQCSLTRMSSFATRCPECFEKKQCAAVRIHLLLMTLPPHIVHVLLPSKLPSLSHTCTQNGRNGTMTATHYLAE